MAEQKPKKRHHYIPVFYLNGFTDSRGCLWVYDKDTGNVFDSKPKAVAFSTDYFSFKTPEGEKDSETIENIIAELEGASAPVIRKILSGETLNTDEQYTFASFVALMMIRAPNHRGRIETAFAEMSKRLMQIQASHKENFEAQIKEMGEVSGTNFGSSGTIEELRQSILECDKHYKLKTNPQVSLVTSLGELSEMTKLFFCMKWIFFRATDAFPFITGDNPFFFCDPTHDKKSPYGVGLMSSKNVEVTLPLSKDILAFGVWQENIKKTYLQASNQWIKQFNRRTVMATGRQVYASINSDSLKRLVMKYKGISPKIVVS